MNLSDVTSQEYTRIILRLTIFDDSKKNYNSMVETEMHSLIETTTEESPTPTAAGLIKGAVFYGGNFTINISSSSSSIVAQQQQTYKRIKRVFDSSDDDESPPLT